MLNLYILAGHDPIPASVLAWAGFFEGPIENRRVDLTWLDTDVYVSTVFLGIDPSFGRSPPLLFESMVFGSELDMSLRRYPIWDEAVAGHLAIVAELRPILAASPSRAVFNRILRVGVSDLET